AAGRALDLGPGTEGEVEHGSQRLVEPAQTSTAIGHERAVLGHAGRDQRMGELQEDRSPPAEQQHHLAIDLPRHATRPGQAGSGVDRLPRGPIIEPDIIWRHHSITRSWPIMAITAIMAIIRSGSLRAGARLRPGNDAPPDARGRKA